MRLSVTFSYAGFNSTHLVCKVTQSVLFFRTLGVVFQSEIFNYNRYNNYTMDSMDSWPYMNSPVLEQNHSKPRLQPGDDIAAITMLYEQCKGTLHFFYGRLCNLFQYIAPLLLSRFRTPANKTGLDTSSTMLKMLPDSIPSSYPQDILCSKPVSTPVPSDNYTTLTSVMAETYDKHELNNIFDSLLQRWPESGAFPDPSPEPLPYSDPFPEEQSSPVYSGSYTGSPQEHFRSDFQFSLGAPAATPYKPSELPMVYLNKGQFYPITLILIVSCFLSQTVVMAVFENDKTPDMQLRFWNHWHARQPTIRQRVIDIADYKEVFNSISNVEEVAFNALSFVWNPSEEAKVYIGINSLSTDFSSQKGVKGQPLNLQIDTYDFSSGTNRLIHRAACQVKIFCDKGAERKMRDEERKRSKRRGKSVDTNANKAPMSSSSDCTFFQSIDDHATVPVLFIPETHLSSMRVSVSVFSYNLQPLKLYFSHVCLSFTIVLLYVRTNAEEIFDALMLSTPTLAGLKEALSQKYNMQADTIGKIFKKCKRGIFVNMDDTIVEHYTNQSAFLIEMSEAAGQIQMTLVEV
uniref:Grh/CP2 DB domain-containing protein n=1 Tax=Periophthalmus magnuspinnatus TaxID=409849 RepID=A0A3B3ZLW1_9GOBI